MKVTIWGARGSHVTPLSPEQVKSKISAILGRLRPEDLRSNESRERFLAALPDWLFGTVGGNTPCVEIVASSGDRIIVDAGTGLIRLGDAYLASGRGEAIFHIFFSHFHYDHLQGLPFFIPAYNPRTELHFYSPVEDLETIVTSQMRHPYFPVTMEGKMTRSLHFHHLPREGTVIGGAKVTWREVNHPGGAYAYRVDDGEKSVVHCSDVELLEGDFDRTGKNTAFYQGLDLLIVDTQYTLGEAIEKYNWGHSSFSLAVDFATAWRVKRMLMFHHEPKYDDRKLYHNLNSARWYARTLGNDTLQIDLSIEGATVEV
ncbi:MAG: MBL fold metallo-hydrolase [Alkalispirochaetaceae bacterium]